MRQVNYGSLAFSFFHFLQNRWLYQRFGIFKNLSDLLANYESNKRDLLTKEDKNFLFGGRGGN